MSSDPFDRQCEFARSLELAFPLVSDPDGAIASRYGARRLLTALDRRITFVIDPAGRVAAVFRHELAIARHDADVRDFLSARARKG